MVNPDGYGSEGGGGGLGARRLALHLPAGMVASLLVCSVTTATVGIYVLQFQPGAFPGFFVLAFIGFIPLFVGLGVILTAVFAANEPPLGFVRVVSFTTATLLLFITAMLLFFEFAVMHLE